MPPAVVDKIAHLQSQVCKLQSEMDVKAQLIVDLERELKTSQSGVFPTKPGAEAQLVPEDDLVMEVNQMQVDLLEVKAQLREREGRVQELESMQAAGTNSVSAMAADPGMVMANAVAPNSPARTIINIAPRCTL